MTTDSQPAVGASPGQPANDGLQFERAEFAMTKARSCVSCSAPIADEFYRLEGQVLCPRCRDRVVQQTAGGNGTRRFIKASIYGVLAAAVGSGLYYAILAVTGYELALISILVGVMVGLAVRAGAERRGGWVYQGLAMFLTYTAIVSAYVPVIITTVKNMNASKPAATATESGKKSEAPKAAASSAEENEEADLAPPRKPGVVGFIITIAVLIAFVYALPFLIGMKNIIGLFIIGIGLYEAWKLNKRQVINIKGPFPAAAAVPAGGAPGNA